MQPTAADAFLALARLAGRGPDGGMDHGGPPRLETGAAGTHPLHPRRASAALCSRLIEEDPFPYMQPTYSVPCASCFFIPSGRGAHWIQSASSPRLLLGSLSRPTYLSLANHHLPFPLAPGAGSLGWLPSRLDAAAAAAAAAAAEGGQAAAT